MLPPHSFAMLVALEILIAAAAVVNAQAPATSDSSLSVGAAVGIAVAVSVAVCIGIAAIVICLLVRHLRAGSKRRRRRRGQHGNNSSNAAATAGTGDQNQTVIRYVEEGSGSGAGSAPVHGMDKQNNSKRSAEAEDELHRISVRVASPDDLRFKVCRRDGQILVATDPVHSSLCSREGVRSGDRILGVHVDIEGSASAHPKEVSELLSLSSDYTLRVEFQHHGPILRGPPPAPTARQRHRPVSAAEKALRKSRDRPVEVVDGDAPPEPEPLVRHSASRSQKLRAPPPPEDRDSVFAIRDRRKRHERRWSPELGIADPEDDGATFEGLCETLAMVEAYDSEWQPLDSKLLTLTAAASSSNSGEVSGVESEAAEEEIDEEALVPEDSAPRQAQQPVSRVERVYDHYELEEQDVVAAMAPPSALRPMVDCCTLFDGDISRKRNSTEAETEVAAAVWQATPAWDCLPNHPERPAGPWVSLANFPVLSGADEAWAAAGLEATTDEPVRCQAVLRVSAGFSGDDGSAVLEMPAASVVADELDGAAEREDEDDRELANYLSGAAQQMREPQQPEPPGDSTASSSVHTVQEEAVTEVLLTKEQADDSRSGYRREDSLVELTRSMALRDVEVATVILLDSEARRRREFGDEDEYAADSGRSTVQEESIDPTQAPERWVRVADCEETADPDEAAAAAMLSADFDLAAAEWAQEQASSPPPATMSQQLITQDEDLALSFVDADRQSPLLDPGLVSEIVNGARNIWTGDDPGLDAEVDDVSLDDSQQLTGESLDMLIDRLENNEEY